MDAPRISTQRTWTDDLLASVVVFLVALPLCMGIAIASGVPPALGLITGIVGGLVVGVIQGSPLQVSGPAAGLAVIVLDLVRTWGLPAFGAIVIVAGLVQVVAALLRGARWFRAVPPSVIQGMLAGIGVLIFASQFHVMVDDKPKGTGLENLFTIPLAVWKGISDSGDLAHQDAAIIGLLTITTILLWARFCPPRWRIVPGPLVAVVLASLAANLLEYPIAYVDVPANLLASVSIQDSASLELLGRPAFWAAAIALAVVASAETLLCATAVDRMHGGPRTRYDRELLAQGIGNAVCGFLGALPMTGVIVRSSANVQAGAKTRLSAVLHGVWLLIFIALVPQLLRFVPVSSLAALLVYTGYKLVNPVAIRQLRRHGRQEVVIYAITVAAIVGIDLLHGVEIGLGIAVVVVFWRLSRLDVSVEDDTSGNRLVLHLRGSATFFRLPDLAEALERIPAGREVHVRFDGLDFFDAATLDLLVGWDQQYARTGGRVVVDWDELWRLAAAHRRKVDRDPASGTTSAPETG